MGRFHAGSGAGGRSVREEFGAQGRLLCLSRGYGWTTPRICPSIFAQSSCTSPRRVVRAWRCARQTSDLCTNTTHPAPRPASLPHARWKPFAVRLCLPRRYQRPLLPPSGPNRCVIAGRWRLKQGRPLQRQSLWSSGCAWSPRSCPHLIPDSQPDLWNKRPKSCGAFWSGN